MRRNQNQRVLQLTPVVVCALFAASCAPRSSPRALGPQPGIHGARDHCEVFLTGCARITRSDLRPGCWVLAVSAEVRGRSADLVCTVAERLSYEGARSRSDLATLTRADGTRVPLAPEWPSPSGPATNDDTMTDRELEDPCARASREYLWEWRVPTEVWLVCSEQPEGSVTIALNGPSLAAYFARSLCLESVTMECPPTTLVIPAVSTDQRNAKPTDGSGIGLSPPAR